MSSPSLKILVCCHKPAELVGGSVYIPVHCGRALAAQPQYDGMRSEEERQWLLRHCIGDDTGEHISDKNRAYCELTAHYWAWKNDEELGSPDYIGFIHYRRGFLPGAAEAKGQIRGFVSMTRQQREQLQDISRLQLGKYDLYAPESVQAYRLKVGEGRYTWTENPPEPCRVIEKNPGNIGLSEALQYVDSHYPERSRYVQEYLEGTRAYQWNMFIMRREMFFRFAAYLFDVLGHVESMVDAASFNAADQRYLAYVGEHLTGAFIHEQVSRGVPVKTLPTYFLLHPALTLGSVTSLRHRLFIYQLKRAVSWGRKAARYADKIAAIKDKISSLTSICV